MADYLYDAKRWFEDSADVSAESLEITIEQMGFKLRDGEALSGDQKSGLREAIAYLNVQLQSMAGAGPEPQSGKEQEPESSIPELDASPLTPVDIEVVSVTKDERRAALSKILESGLVSKGVSMP